MPSAIFVLIPKCIASYVQCGLGRISSVRLFRYKVVSTQMEVDFETHLMSIRHKRRSIRYKLKPLKSKSELAEIHLLHIMCGYQCEKAVTKNDTREMI